MLKIRSDESHLFSVLGEGSLSISLASALANLIKTKASGTLHIRHEFGSQAVIVFKGGNVFGIEVVNGGVNGAAAVKMLASWATISTKFSDGVFSLKDYSSPVDTEALLGLFIKLEKQIQQIKKVIPGNDAIFRVVFEDWSDSKEFSREELKVAVNLDGRNSVREVVRKSGIPELAALRHIYSLCRRGLVQLATAHQPLEETARGALLDGLKEFLSEMLGPAADMIIHDAFESMRTEPELLSQVEIPHLIDAILDHLNDDERSSFEEWVHPFIAKVTGKTK